MSKAKKLPSGSWNVSVYSHTENGKRKYVSFTAPTKAQAELKASEYKTRKHRIARYDLIVSDALNGYIEAKKAVLSPSTIRGYMGMLDYFDPISNRRIRSLTNEDVQLFVSDLGTKLSPKTVQNIYGLLNVSVAFYAPDLFFRITLPTKQKKRPVSPSDDAVRTLLQNADDKLRLCILLGMRGLRRGEISALKYEDVTDGMAHIHADMIKGPDGKWVYKEIPKTEGSDRYIRVPDVGTGSGFIVKWKPDTLTKRFIELRNKCGYDFTFHDLRHYFASTAAVLGIPDIYTADLGGWERNSSTMKSVYQNNISSMSEYYAEKMEKHLKKIGDA